MTNPSMIERVQRAKEAVVRAAIPVLQDARARCVGMPATTPVAWRWLNDLDRAVRELEAAEGEREMNESMIERVARAIFSKYPLRPGPHNDDLMIWDRDATDSDRFACVMQARAAIAAMREPTPEMVKAMIHDHDIQGVVYLRGPAAYTAGIDKALEE